MTLYLEEYDIFTEEMTLRYLLTLFIVTYDIIGIITPPYKKSHYITCYYLRAALSYWEHLAAITLIRYTLRRLLH